MKYIKLFENFHTEISEITPEDNDAVIDVLHEVFGSLDSREVIKSRIQKRLNNGLSVKIVYDGKIVGCYLLAEKSVNEFISDIEQDKVSDFRRNDTSVDLQANPGDRGLQGIALAVMPEYRDLELGKKMKNYVRGLGYDYIWGVQDKKLMNINFWKRSREVFAESPTKYATIEILR